jgi:hypothetical protein
MRQFYTHTTESQRVIDLLQERRTAQIDVRGVA